MVAPFENPSNNAHSAGMTYKRAALLAGGIGAVAWYLLARRDTRQPPAANATLKHPTRSSGTVMHNGTDRK